MSYCICLLYSPIIHAIFKQIAICNEGYKFATYLHNILIDLLLINELIVLILLERFSPENVRKLQVQHYRFL